MEFILFILTYFLLAVNVIGYGYFFATNISSYNKNANIGYIGLYGVFLLTFISYLTNLVVKHDYLHNFILLILGIFFFVKYISSIKNLNKNKDVKYLIFFLVLSIFAILYFKSHDDFSYYHLSFIHNLTLNKVEFGLGNFDLAFNHVSSMFFFHSLFNLPFTNDYFYFIGPVLIMVFSNIVLVKKILNDKKKITFNFFLSFFIFVFINVFFYRLAEHGTDRSAIILILLSILLIFQILDNKILNNKMFENLIIFLTFIISLKSFYIIYSLLFFIIYFKFFSVSKIITFYKNFKIINISIIFGLLILFYNIAYTGCLIYPLSFTCSEFFYWSMDISRIELAANWYELWSKAGASPNYRVDDPNNYVSGFNWVTVWIDNYFFNKVSDTSLGLLFVVLFFLITFRPKKIKFKFNREYFLVFIALTILLFEWFFNHPSLRYGGYHLLALIFFIPTAIFLSNQNYQFAKVYKKIQIILIISLTVFVLRNMDRILNEYEIYNYNPLNSPFYKLEQKDYYLKNKKKNIYEKTNNCLSEYKKNHNCKIISSYRFFY